MLFVFAWLVVGGEETEVRRLAKHLDAARYRLDVSPASNGRDARKTHSNGGPRDYGRSDTVPVSFEDTVDYFIRRLPTYDMSWPAKRAGCLPCAGALSRWASLDRTWRSRRRSVDRAEAFHSPLRRRLPDDP